MFEAIYYQTGVFEDLGVAGVASCHVCVIKPTVTLDDISQMCLSYSLFRAISPWLYDFEYLALPTGL